jgi:hypothetical protein
VHGRQAPKEHRHKYHGCTRSDSSLCFSRAAAVLSTVNSLFFAHFWDKIHWQMAALISEIVRGVGGGVSLVLIYGLYAWRLFKNNPGDKFVESGSVTLFVFILVLASFRVPHVPGWVSGSLIFLLCITTFLSLFFMFQYGYFALRERLTHRKSSVKAK